MKKHKIWQFNEFNKDEAKLLGQELGVSPLVAGILLNRGIKDAGAAREFLYGSAEPLRIFIWQRRAVSRPVFDEGYGQIGRAHLAGH